MCDFKLFHFQDLFPESPPLHHGFQLSPDFRPRASSNASSCGGRLSPIPAVESDIHESDMPPLSPIPWNGELPHLSYEGANVASGGTMDRYEVIVVFMVFFLHKIKFNVV